MFTICLLTSYYTGKGLSSHIASISLCLLLPTWLWHYFGYDGHFKKYTTPLLVYALHYLLVLQKRQLVLQTSLLSSFSLQVSVIGLWLLHCLIDTSSFCFITVIKSSMLCLNIDSKINKQYLHYRDLYMWHICSCLFSWDNFFDLAFQTAFLFSSTIWLHHILSFPLSFHPNRFPIEFFPLSKIYLLKSSVQLIRFGQ